MKAFLSACTACMLLVSVEATSERGKSDGKDHWAFQPIVQPALPTIDETGEKWVKNPIDRFIWEKLNAEGIKPAPEANRPTQIRRLYLDLLGLLPSPEEVDAFSNDLEPNAYDRLVNRLLASPHFGERWGRHWLDEARYADSDGFEKDLPRPFAWRYRDWVINAYNSDLPYDQFITDQLAGDLLPGNNPQALTATGFHRNTLTNREGGVDQEEYRVEQVVNRTNTTSSTFLGLTMGCAQCHDHKYDPLSQKEYFGLYGFFNSGMEKDVETEDPIAMRTWKTANALIDSEYKKFEKQAREYKKTLIEKLPEWEAQYNKDALKWVVLSPETFHSESNMSYTFLDDGSVLGTGPPPGIDTYTLTASAQVENVVALRLEVLTDESLPKTGPGRASHGNFILYDFEAHIAPKKNPDKKLEVLFSNAWADLAEKGWPIENVIDEDKNSGWSAYAYAGHNEQRTAIFTTAETLGSPDHVSTFTFRFEQNYGTGHVMGRFRMLAATGDAKKLMTPVEITQILEMNPSKRSAKQTEKLITFFGQDDPRLKELTITLEALNKARPKKPDLRVQAIVANPEPPETHILIRGDFLRKGEKVEPHTPSILPAMKSVNETPNRLDLANWIISTENPLTSRVATNRVWTHLFGAGLVKTNEDFGTRGEMPSHPELLDWLSNAYMRNGWSRKALIREIVTSATYRQSSRKRQELMERDPDNRWLAYQNRYRVQAETTRDLFLQASGLLNDAVGGPSIRPSLPESVRGLGYANSIKWKDSQGDEQFRRGMYIHFQRTVPFPMLMAFDCPDSNVTIARRSRSNTPLQALTLLNDPIFVQCAQALGLRALSSAEESHEARIRTIFRWCLGRTPSDLEVSKLLELLKDQESIYTAQPDEALQLAGTSVPEHSSAAEVAAYTTLSRVILNLDEFLTRE